MTEAEASGFRGRDLFGSVIAVPLLERMRQEIAPTPHRVMIDLHLGYPQGREAAAKAARKLVRQAVERSRRRDPGGVAEGVDEERSDRLDQYVVASLTTDSIREVVRLDHEASERGEGSDL
jgi:hypothetical protein